MKNQLISRNQLCFRWVGALTIAGTLAGGCFAQTYSPAPSVSYSYTNPQTGMVSTGNVNSGYGPRSSGGYATAPVYRPVGQNAALDVGSGINSAPYNGQIIFQNPEDARLFSGQPVGDIPSTATAPQAAPIPGSYSDGTSGSAVPMGMGTSATTSISTVPTTNGLITSGNSSSAPCPPGYGSAGLSGGSGAASGLGLPVPFGGQNAPAPKGDQYPNDEYISDGGVGPKGVRGRQDWKVDGLRPTDKIVHFDTLDGQVKVEASNKVEIYAPKFRSVRQVIDVVYNDQVQRLVNVDARQKLASQDRNVGEMTSKRHVPVAENASLTPGEQFVSRIGGAEVSNRRALMAFDNNYKAYEDFLVIRTGETSRSEMAMTAEMERRASVWSYTRNTQVLVGEQRVMASVKDEGPGVLYTLDKDTDNPQVRIVKIASTDSAQPGDRVEFTIRFDNTGDEAVGNVTIIDSLAGRLEYAEGTAQCSKTGNFSVEQNEAESLVLRWEITDPLEPGDGGIIRFECTVR